MDRLRHRQRGNLTFWQTVWTGVISSLVASLVTYMLNPSPELAWVKVIVDALKTVGGWTWGLLAYSIPIPVSLLVAATLWTMLRWLRAIADRPAVSAAAAPLDANEEAVLRSLASEDGRALDNADFQRITGRSFLLVAKAIDGLGHRGYLEHRRGIAGSEFYLSTRGRDFVIAQGWAPEKPIDHYRR